MNIHEQISLFITCRQRGDPFAPRRSGPPPQSRPPGVRAIRMNPFAARPLSEVETWPLSNPSATRPDQAGPDDRPPWCPGCAGLGHQPDQDAALQP